MTLKYPYLLLLLLLYIPLLWYWLSTENKRYSSIFFSSLGAFKNKKVGGRACLIPVLRVLYLLSIGSLIVALARPQYTDSLSSSHIYGTDIVLAIDISESMNNADIQPSRFSAAKTTALDFISNRDQDNIGLVIFAGEALSIMPLTNDHVALQNAVKNIQTGQLANGTAIGDGLVSAINRVLNGQAKSKSIILLTDGTNNTGDVAPSTAAEIASLKGIKVYTIGIGLDGKSIYIDPFGFTRTSIDTPIDEETLKDIAVKTGGEYFRATDADALRRVFAKIDELEKTSMDSETVTRTEEAFMPWILIALCCFATAILIKNTFLTKIP